MPVRSSTLTWARVGALAVIAMAAICMPACSSEAPAGDPDVPADGAAPEDELDAGDANDASPPKDAAPDRRDGSVAATGPCGKIPVDGTCVSPTQVQTCVVPTNQGTATVVTQTCAAYAQCAVVQGKARCVASPGKCEPGASECVSTSVQRRCDNNGAWIQTACAGCNVSSLGAVCPDAAFTTLYTGTVQYEFRGPNATFTDWDTTTSISPAVGALVVSYRWSASMEYYYPLDAVVADASGGYTIHVATALDPADLINVFAIRSTPSGFLFAVAQPDVSDGTANTATPVPSGGANATYWGWSNYVQTLGPSGSNFLITEAMGSGALRVFDNLRYAYDATTAVLGASGKSVVVWLRNNTSWNCGSCFQALPTTFLGHAFDSQMFLPAVAQNTGYWADPVTSHELGHWVMASYGTSPNEGGPHEVACPTYPGQAWSEGWATGFSSLARASPKYYDKQGGTFFWLDIAQHSYGGGAPWTSPSSAGGLLQPIDENMVAATIWSLADNATTPVLSVTSNGALFNALKSPRMTKAPFARGYTSHTWQGGCEPRTSVVDTGSPAPMMADYLDALVCAGMAPSKVTSAIGTYPYAAGAPVCK